MNYKIVFFKLSGANLKISMDYFDLGMKTVNARFLHKVNFAWPVLISRSISEAKGKNDFVIGKNNHDIKSKVWFILLGVGSP